MLIFVNSISNVFWTECVMFPQPLVNWWFKNYVDFKSNGNQIYLSRLLILNYNSVYSDSKEYVSGVDFQFPFAFNVKRILKEM